MLGRSETPGCGPSLDDEARVMLPDITVTREHKLLILVNQLLLFLELSPKGCDRLGRTDENE